MTDAEKIQFIVGYYGLENQLIQTAEEPPDDKEEEEVLDE